MNTFDKIDYIAAIEITEGITIKCLLWNINKKNLVQELKESIIENDTEIVIVIESENLDTEYLLSLLKKYGKKFKKKEIFPKSKDIILLSSSAKKVFVYKEEKYFSMYKIHDKGKKVLLVATHLSSAMYSSEIARIQRANDLAKTIEKLEDVCNMETHNAGEKSYQTIIVGDFNLQPFSAGIIGKHGFNAIMDPYKALKPIRKKDGSTAKFYYNPMWHLMGKHDSVLGTYYYDADQDDNSFFWYTFDQILIRPELINDFLWDEFKIIDCIGDKALIKGNRINKNRFSDHLPIKFEIKGGAE